MSAAEPAISVLEAEVTRLSGLLGRATDDGTRLRILEQLLASKEMRERERLGLPPHHGLELADLLFHHAISELQTYCAIAFAVAEKSPDDPNALVSKATALFCSGAGPEIEEVVSRIRPYAGNHIWSSVTFDPTFYRECGAMGHDDLLRGLPALEIASFVPAADTPILFLSCDYNYFGAFCAPLLRSLAAQGHTQHVHVHVMDCAPEKLRRVVAFSRELSPLSLGMSVENPSLTNDPNARNYYHAVRFIRLYQMILHYRRPIWMMDVDALFNGGADAIFRKLSGRDAAFRIRPGRIEPWNQFNACMVGAAPTVSGLGYFKIIAGYIARYFQDGRLRWGIDQMAMFGAWRHLQAHGVAPSIELLDDKVLDYAYRDDGLVWCNSGKNKFAHIQRKPGAPIPADDAGREKYIALFDKFRA